MNKDPEKVRIDAPMRLEGGDLAPCLNESGGGAVMFAGVFVWELMGFVVFSSFLSLKC